ncbi:MAG: citrate/2-methylcitrate synthase [Chloroflexota bacterium]
MAMPAVEGLENVVVATTSISEVRGQTGELLYQGYDIRELARESSFEEVVWLLWHGELPSPSELTAFRAELARNRTLPTGTAALVDRLAAIPASPMVMLRMATSRLEIEDPRASSIARPDEQAASLQLVARFPTIVARYARRRRGREPVEPPPNADTATAFLTMLHDQAPSQEGSHALDGLLILHADHEFNASTFTARVIAATLANVYASVAGAIAALSGPLHGGANARVMKMLEAIGSPGQAESYVQSLLSTRQRIMGFGHRVYKVEDPRAVILRHLCQELARQTGDATWYDIATKVAETVWNARRLYPNVDFFSAPVQHMLGIPTDLFTMVFAMSRVSGWTAHVMEQHANNRLIRPRAAYVGPPERPYVPLSAR